MNEREIRLDDIMPLIREKLSAGKSVIFSPRGKSMLPTLHEGRDSVTLVSPPARLEKYDIALYQRKNGQYVLHRVVRVGDTYTFIGDNQFNLEKGIEHSSVIGLCASYVRNGKKIVRNSFRARAYATFLHYTRFPRRIFRAIARRLTRVP